MTLSQISKLIDLCRKNNIRSIKVDNIELVFGEEPRPIPQQAEEKFVSSKIKNLELLFPQMTQSELAEMAEKF